jgi:chondroitin AC lyase
MLWFDHGHRPSNASYQYIVVPDISLEQLQETAYDNRHIEILSNTAEMQAVRHRKLGLCQIAFYKAGEIEISEGIKVKSESQGMVMLKLQAGRMDKMAISDPSRKLGRMRITVSNMYEAKGDNFVMLPNSEQNETLILVDLPQGVYAGKSTIVEL